MTTQADIVLTASELAVLTKRLAHEISAANPDGCLMVGLLKSGAVPLADVVRHMTVPVRIDFIALSSYAPDSGRVQLRKDLDNDISGDAVVLLAGLVDTGMRLAFLRGELQRRRPASLQTATMFDKVDRRILPVPIDHIGTVVPDAFLLGYGLDYEGLYRNLPVLAAGNLDELEADPAVYTKQFYGH